MTYEELWAAQVRARALTRHDIYCALQNELKGRTKLGHISGFIKIPMRSLVWPYKKKKVMNLVVMVYMYASTTLVKRTVFVLLFGLSVR